jgi:hypothetical protein
MALRERWHERGPEDPLRKLYERFKQRAEAAEATRSPVVGAGIVAEGVSCVW